MKKVYIVPGCISCGSCEVACPNVFEVTDVARVKEDANFEENKEEIREAAEICPVNVIKYDE